MKIAIAGFEGSGKSTVFKALITTHKNNIEFDPTKQHIVRVEVPDPRLQTLASIFKPKKITFEELYFIDLPGFNLAAIKEFDAVMHVVGVFSGRDYVKDIENMELEFMLSDLGIIEKRLASIEKEIKSHPHSDKEIEKKILLNYKRELEQDISLREVRLNPEEEKIITGYQFLSKKPIFIVANLEESQLSSALPHKIAEFAKEIDLKCIISCAKIESEIQDLEDNEKEEFIKGLGLEDFGYKRVVRTAREALDLATFFTVKGDETKAWTIQRGTKALDAAGKVHTDIQKGFIKAEVIGYNDFVRCGSLVEARNRGLLKLEGKEYIVKDGDIIDFKFNV